MNQFSKQLLLLKGITGKDLGPYCWYECRSDASSQQSNPKTKGFTSQSKHDRGQNEKLAVRTWSSKPGHLSTFQGWPLNGGYMYTRSASVGTYHYSADVGAQRGIKFRVFQL